jgi:hypothetical protein
MAPGQAGGCLTSLQGLLHFFGCQEHLDIHQVLRGRGSSGHNTLNSREPFAPVPHKQRQLARVPPLQPEVQAHT